MPIPPDQLRAVLDAARAVPGTIGLRPFRVFLRIREWSGSIPGEGEKIDNAGTYRN